MTHMMLSCDSFSPSTVRRMMSPLAFPVQAQNSSLRPHSSCKQVLSTCVRAATALAIYRYSISQFSFSKEQNTVNVRKTASMSI